MGDRFLQDPRGVLWFGSVSIGIVLCTISIWFLVVRESSIKRIDQILRNEVTKTSTLLNVLEAQNPQRVETIPAFINGACLDSQDILLEIYDIRKQQYLFTTAPDSTFHLSSPEFPLPATPVITTLKNDSTYRTFGQGIEGYRIEAAIPLPSFWNLMSYGFSDLTILMPILIVVLAVVGIWSFIRLHHPIQKLDQYLQTLIQQPLDKELLKPPLSPKGDIYRLTQTVSKIVERLHVSRNQALQFSSYASHELRTPLTIIRNQLESALASGSKPKELRGIVASTYDEMLRLNRAVEDLLSLGTMQAGSLALNLETISLPKFLNHFYDEAMFLSRPKNISVVLKKGPEVYLQGDVIRLRQVFFNLLDNAIKNMSPGKRIRLSYAVKESNVNIVFTDTGNGIAQDKLEKIFEPFFTSAPKGGNHHGAGLGLALVKWIIELHRGNISVTSEIGSGTEFTISLPFEKIVES